MIKLSLAVAAAICVVAVNVDAQPWVSGSYVTVDGGISLMPDQDLQTGGTGLKELYGTGSSFGGGFGMADGNGWRTEIDAQWSHAPMHGTGISGYTNGTSVMASELYDLTAVGTVTPYVGAGVGYVNIVDKVNDAKDADWQPGYQLRGGLKMPLTEQLTGHAEYRWQQAEDGRLDLASVEYKQPYKNNAILLGVDYAF